MLKLSPTLFCFQCDDFVETIVIAEEDVEFESYEIKPKNSDLEGQGTRRLVSICPVCNQPFLLRASLCHRDGPFAPYIDCVVLYPRGLK